MTMKCYKVLLAFIYVFIALSLTAQTVKVTGVVVDENNKPVEFVNVVLTGSNEKINGTISNENGTFEIKVPNDNYKLTVSSIGYDVYTSTLSINKDTNLGSIVIKTAAQQLGEAVVTAKLIDRKADRFVMNIQSNPIASGKNTVELLSLAPSVWIDRQRGISINGKSDIKIMINDRIVNMSTDELISYLETIKAEDIQSIEIITDPGAEYEANSNSGILHIKLKRGFQGGLTGSVSMNLQIVRNKYSYNPNINLNYRRNKLSLYGAFLINNWQSEGDGQSTSYFQNQNKSILTTNKNQYQGTFWRASFGTVYELTKNQEIGFTFESRNNSAVNKSTDTTKLITNNVLTKKTIAENRNDFQFHRYDASINYKLKTDSIGSNLKLFLDYTKNKFADNYLWNNYFNNNNAPDSTYVIKLPSDFEIYAVRADYLKKFNNRTSISFGGRYGYAKMHYNSKHEDFDSGAWKENSKYTDDYTYNEHIGALYAKFDSQWGKLAYTLGVRYENTSLNIADAYKPAYNDIFPNVFLKYTLNEKKGHSLNASYNRKLSRPYYTNLNPFKEWIDEYTYRTGNPYLRPTYSDALSVGATLFDKYILTLQYTNFTDVVNRITQASPEPNISMIKSENIDEMKLLYASLYIPVKVTSWYNFTLNLSASKQTLQSQTFNNQSWIYRGNTQHTLTLPKNWTVSIDAWFSSKSTYSNMQVSAMGGVNGSISKKMLNNKLVASANVWNIQGFRYVTLNYKATDYQRRERWLNQNQVFNFTLTYNFSAGKKVDVKKVEKGIEDERL